MRSFALILGASVAALGLAAGGSARPQTTNPGGYHTVRVVLTDGAVTMSSTHEARGSTAIFIVSNRGTSPRVLAVGDASLTHRRGTGFAVKLGRNEQKRILVYLSYRGPLPLTVTAGGKPKKVVGVFYVT